MKVDRQSFLLAAAALAASCGPSPGAPPTTVAIPPQPSAAPAETSEWSPPPKPPAPVAEDSSRRFPNNLRAPADEGLASPVDEGLAVDAGGMCRAKNVKRPVAAACSDDVGKPGDCKKANCSLQFVCTQCEAYKKYFKPRVAERAVACIVGQTRNQARDGCRTYQCGDEALGGACLDAAADVPCRAIAKSCKTSLDECRGLLSGMNAAGRAKMSACAAQGCSYGLWSCVESL
ncbi:MAG: hypothetical protein JNL38_17055 [Myxococcales bacterium]|nr:hypothetical protein [Myxococcales bacterium]